MKMIYCSSISYPSAYANRLQTLYTSQALAEVLGDVTFVLGAQHVQQNALYTHRIANFFSRSSPILAWKQLAYMRKNAINVVYSREHPLLFMMMLYNTFVFRLPLSFFIEEHVMRSGFRFGFVIRRVRHAFCITGLLSQELVRAYPGISTSVLPDGVRLEDFSQPTDDEIRHVLALPPGAMISAYIGSVGLYDWKGVDVFLDSLQFNDDPRLVCVVAGVKPPHEEELRAMYPDQRIKILPWVDRKGVAALMDAADVLILPNKSGSAVSEKYTSPMKLFEYMASGTPIVASDLPSIREILSERTAILVPPNDPKALASGIRKIFADPEGARAMAARAKEDVAQYSWHNRAQKIISAIRGFDV